MLTGRLFQYSRKPKEVQINSSQASPAHGTPNGYGSQLRHQRSLTSALGQGGYGTWSGPPPLSPAVSTSRSTLALETNNSASIYSYTLASGPSRKEILQRAAERGPTDTVTSVHYLFFSPSLPPPPPKIKLLESICAIERSRLRIDASLLFCGLGHRVAFPSGLLRSLIGGSQCVDFTV